MWGRVLCSWDSWCSLLVVVVVVMVAVLLLLLRGGRGESRGRIGREEIGDRGVAFLLRGEEGVVEGEFSRSSVTTSREG